MSITGGGRYSSSSPHGGGNIRFGRGFCSYFTFCGGGVIWVDLVDGASTVIGAVDSGRAEILSIARMGSVGQLSEEVESVEEE